MKVRLIKSHTHGGATYEATTVIEVAPHEARWLERQGVIKPVKQKSTTPGDDGNVPPATGGDPE